MRESDLDCGPAFSSINHTIHGHHLGSKDKDFGTVSDYDWTAATNGLWLNLDVGKMHGAY